MRNGRSSRVLGAVEDQSFGQVLQGHLTHGTRPTGAPDRAGRQWSAKEFADAVGVSDRTVRYWLSDQHPPSEVATIERLLFGGSVNFDAERLVLRRAHMASLNPPRASVGLTPGHQAVFVQLLNPEMMKLHGHSAGVSSPYLPVVSTYFKYAFILSPGPVVMPSSYLFETENIDHALGPMEALLEEGALQLSNPTVSLESYRDHKEQIEYRDRNSYARPKSPSAPVKRAIPIVPRVRRSTARDISDAWSRGVEDSNTWIVTILERLRREGHKLDSLENRFATLPALLEGRAFIQEFVEKTMRYPLTPQEKLQLAYFLSREYLLSYLREYDAIILNDTPLGRFDCGLPLDDDERHLSVSLRDLRNLFELLGIREQFENHATWEDVRALRANPVVTQFCAVATKTRRLPFQARNIKKPSATEQSTSGGDAGKIVLDALNTFIERRAA